VPFAHSHNPSSRNHRPHHWRILSLRHVD
jgi:hypothetical protein